MVSEIEAMALCAAFGLGFFVIDVLHPYARYLTIVLGIVAMILAAEVLFALGPLVDRGAAAKALMDETEAVGGF